jgi:ABC-type Fe3+-siderophore transport system permease subunit
MAPWVSELRLALAVALTSVAVDSPAADFTVVAVSPGADFMVVAVSPGADSTAVVVAVDAANLF